MKFAVRLIKNTFHPLKVQDDVNLKQDQLIIVRTEKGEEVHKVIVVNEEISKHWQKYKPEALSVVRVMTDEDIEKYKEQKELEIKALLKCREFAGKRKLVMNLTKAVYTFDRKKITFYYTAPERVDFRALLKDLTQVFTRVRIDLRHIGVRDETSIVEGTGICGRPFCCSSFLRKFATINVKLAKDQGMPIAPGKISGTCGRLLCCLTYEYSHYIDAAKGMPPVGSSVMTPDGLGKVCYLQFLSGKVAVKMEDGKVKEFLKTDIEMVDAEVNVEIDIPTINSYDYEQENIDIKQLEDDKNSSTGNV